MSNSSYLDGFRASFAAQMTRILVNGLVVLLLTRYFLSPEEYGVLFLAISILASSLLFSRLGIPKAAARYVTEYREVDSGQVRNIVQTSFKIITITAFTVGSLLALSRGAVASVFDEPTLLPLLLCGFFYIIFRTYNSYFYTLFQGFNHISKSAYLLISSNLGILIGILLFVTLGYGAIGALIGYVIGYGLGTVVGLIFLYRTIRKYEVRPIEPGLRRRIFEYSIPLTATNGANILYKKVDVMLIGFFLTPVAIGYYTLAKQLSDFIIAPAESLGFTISPSYGEHKANGDSQRAARIYETAFEHTLLFYVPAAAGLILVAEPMIEFIFGADYLGTVPVIQVFSGFIVLQAVDKITNDGLDYLGRARHRAIVKTSTGFFNLGLNLVLIPTIGVVGAAVSTVISYGMMVTINVYLIHTELSLALERLFRSIIRICGITVCMSAIVVILLPFISSLATLLFVVTVGGTTWLFLALATGIPNVDVDAILS